MENKIVTLEQFRATKRGMSAAEFSKQYGIPEGQINSPFGVYAYGEGYYIEIIGDGGFHLKYFDGMRNMECSVVENDINYLDELFWDEFVKGELGVTSEQAFDDLTQRSKAWIVAQGFPANSLDDLQYEDLFVKPFMNAAQKEQTRYYLKQFTNH